MLIVYTELLLHGALARRGPPRLEIVFALRESIESRGSEAADRLRDVLERRVRIDPERWPSEYAQLDLERRADIVVVALLNRGLESTRLGVTSASLIGYPMEMGNGDTAAARALPGHFYSLTRFDGVLQKLRRIEHRMIAKAHEGEPQEFLDGLHASMREQQKQRDAKREIAKISERRKHPPDPRASSVLAAVMSSRFLADALERRLRDDILVVEEGRERRVPKGAFVNARVLDAKDVAVLYVAAVTIEDGGLLRTHEPDLGLSTIADVPGSLRNLRVNGLLDVTRDGNTWRVAWGERALKIAREAGVGDIPSAVAAAPEAVISRS